MLVSNWAACNTDIHDSVWLNEVLWTLGSPPSNLYTVSNSNGIVTLSWSPPLTSADYCTSNDCFEYTVNLTDEADHSITLYTQQTTLNVTRLNITNGLDPCVNYTWSVTAVAANGFKTKTVMGNQSFLLQAGLYNYNWDIIMFPYSLLGFCECFCCRSWNHYWLRLQHRRMQLRWFGTSC